ncbi:hypothetical protein D3C80_1242020 [compost metagenome]
MKSLTGVSTGARPRRPMVDRHAQVSSTYRIRRRKARSSSSRSSGVASPKITLAQSVLNSWVKLAGTDTNSKISTNTDASWWTRP